MSVNRNERTGTMLGRARIVHKSRRNEAAAIIASMMRGGKAVDISQTVDHYGIQPISSRPQDRAEFSAR